MHGTGTTYNFILFIYANGMLLKLSFYPASTRHTATFLYGKMNFCVLWLLRAVPYVYEVRYKTAWDNKPTYNISFWRNVQITST